MTAFIPKDLQGQIDLASEVLLMHKYTTPAVVTETTEYGGNMSLGFHFDIGFGREVGDVIENDDHSASRVLAIVKYVFGEPANYTIVETELAAKYWRGGKAPWDMTTAEFMEQHYTGFISSSAYEAYEKTGGIAWIGNIDKFPVVVATDRNGIEYRKSVELSNYLKADAEGEIVRHAQTGEAILMSPPEKVLARAPRTDRTIVAFSNGEPVGLVSNEFGAVGVWVEERAQKKGIGTALLKRYLEENPSARIGQMTNAGINMVRRLHATFVWERYLTTGEDLFVACEEGNMALLRSACPGVEAYDAARGGVRVKSSQGLLDHVAAYPADFRVMVKVQCKEASAGDPGKFIAQANSLDRTQLNDWYQTNVGYRPDEVSYFDNLNGLRMQVAEMMFYHANGTAGAWKKTVLDAPVTAPNNLSI